jgi:hypothetical protein
VENTLADVIWDICTRREGKRRHVNERGRKREKLNGNSKGKLSAER